MSESMTERWGFQAPSARRRAAELVALWQQARDATHPPTCLCQGFAATFPDPEIIEQNMLDALRSRYRDAGDGDLLALIEARRARSPFAGLRPTFEAWLGGLAEQPLAPAARDRLFGDLRATLRAFGDAGTAAACL